jgi:hypothetical protein
MCSTAGGGEGKRRRRREADAGAERPTQREAPHIMRLKDTRERRSNLLVGAPHNVGILARHLVVAFSERDRGREWGRHKRMGENLMLLWTSQFSVENTFYIESTFYHLNTHSAGQGGGMREREFVGNSLAPVRNSSELRGLCCRSNFGPRTCGRSRTIVSK